MNEEKNSTARVDVATKLRGRAWSLEEVRELLGHSSIAITERYAHFSRDLLGRAARETILQEGAQ